MEDSKKKYSNDIERDIVFSKTVKAGKRIYYIDVKKSRNEDMYIAITESKKVVASDNAQNVSFEKHKIFLYKEDFKKFLYGLAETVKYVEDRQGTATPHDNPKSEEEEKKQDESPEESQKPDIHFDIEF